MLKPTKPSNYLINLASQKQQKHSCQNLINTLRVELERKEPDFEAYLIITQRGRIAIGILERMWHLSDNVEHKIVYEIPAFNLLEYRVYPLKHFDPWLDASRKETEKEMRAIVPGGVFEVLTAVHFPFRKDSIMDYQLGWMKQRRR